MKRMDDPLDIMLEFQSWRGSAQPLEDSDEESTHHKNQRGWPDFAIPRSIRTLKGKLPDYRPGPVKIYTKKEIEEYERVRSQQVHR